MVTLEHRRLAGAVHAVSIFAPFVTPVVAMVIWGKVPFVAAHAKRALFEFLGLKLISVALGILSLSYSVVHLYRSYQNNFEDFTPWPILIKGLILWLLFLGFEVLNSVLSLRQALSALRGDWPKGSKQLAG